VRSGRGHPHAVHRECQEMRILLLGPPGCGKGTQAKLLCKKFGWEHIGTGDLLREAMRKQTPVGLRAQPFVDKGNLVPDELVNDLIAERFAREDRPAAFVMDGYPRTLAQAEAFDGILAKVGKTLDIAFLIDVPDQSIVKRVCGRWSCPKLGCKATYHTHNNPPLVAGVCNDCGVALVQRADDSAETVTARLVVYHKDTERLIPYYHARGILVRVEGGGEVKGVFGRITEALGKVCK